MLEFLAKPECRACPLWELSDNPGIVTRMPDFQSSPLHSKALIVIGQNPGQQEDATGLSWKGHTGQLLHAILKDHLEVQDHADVYLMNSARCRTPNNKDPNISCRKKCWPHQQSDISAILRHYDTPNVTVLGMGAAAVWLCTGESIKRSVAHNGAPRAFPRWGAFGSDGKWVLNPEPFALPMFFTYHPAATLPGRNPSLLQPMEDHLRLLKDHLTGKTVTPDLPQDMLVAPDYIEALRDCNSPPTVAIDIETYGILKGQEQTTFHPRKMVAIDGIPRAKLIVRVALAWHDGVKIKSATYCWSSPAHRRALYSALRNLPPRITILGQNLCFDISVLRFASPELAMLLRPGRFLLDDTIILNHLDSDMRPERSLKAVGTLFRTMDYESMLVSPSKKHMQATSENDPNLIVYNCGDAVATLRNHDIHKQNIKAQHGHKHPALTPFGGRFRSELLWTALHLIESGMTFDKTKLEALHEQKLIEQKRLIDDLYSRDVIVRGAGSEKSLRRAILVAAGVAGLLDDPRLETTDIKKDISVGRANIHLLLRTLPAGSEDPDILRCREDITMIEEFKKAQKITSTYTGPLLGRAKKVDPNRGCLPGHPASPDIITACPTWYPAPAYVKDTQGSEGGTRQGRFSAKDPAAQTFPPSISDCMTSRYGSDGILASYDMAQHEMRMAALQSGDPAMLSAFTEDRDIHSQTALAIWPKLPPDAPDFGDWRQVAKRINFLTLYLGGVPTLIEHVREDIGWELTASEANDILRAFNEKYRVFRKWQQELLWKAAKDGFILLPITGWKRTFLGGPDGALQSYSNEMANMPIQTLAAQTVQASQYQIILERQQRLLTFQIASQEHDSTIIDCHRSCFPEVDKLVTHHLLHSPLWFMLEDHYGHKVPCKVERKLLNTGTGDS